MQHLIRKGLDTICPVCSATPFQACIEAAGGIDPEPRQMRLSFPVASDTDQVGWCEFEVLRAITRLRELQPGHPLVLVFIEALDQLAVDQSRQPLDHPQAD